MSTEFGSLHEPAPLRGAAGRRAAFVGGFVLLLAVLVGGLAYVVIHFQAQSRAQARDRFRQQSNLTADFTGSLLTSSAASAAAARRSSSTA